MAPAVPTTKYTGLGYCPWKLGNSFSVILIYPLATAGKLLGRDFWNFEERLWREEHIVVPKTPPHSFFPIHRLPISGKAYRIKYCQASYRKKTPHSRAKTRCLCGKEGPGRRRLPSTTNIGIMELTIVNECLAACCRKISSSTIHRANKRTRKSFHGLEAMLGLMQI